MYLVLLLRARPCTRTAEESHVEQISCSLLPSFQWLRNNGQVMIPMILVFDCRDNFDKRVTRI